MSLMLLGHVDLAEATTLMPKPCWPRQHRCSRPPATWSTCRGAWKAWLVVAAARGDYERTAELDGARGALRNQIGVFLPPVHPAGYSHTLETARAGLTQAAFDAARARAAGQTPPQIIATALSGLAAKP